MAFARSLIVGPSTLLFFALLLSLTPTVCSHPYVLVNAPDLAAREETAADQIANGQTMYGLGVRLGSYFQAVSFVFGILGLESIDPKAQFAGTILVLQLAVNWFWRLGANTMSASELWIGLAQLLMITTPGAILLFLSFSYQRRHWKTVDGREMLRKEVIRTGGLNFVQVLLVLLAANAANAAFVYIVWKHKPPLAPPYQDPIWMWQMWRASDKILQVFLLIQSLVTGLVIELPPFLIYSIACWEQFRDWRVIQWGSRRSAHYDRIDENDRRTRDCMHKLLDWAPYGVKSAAIAVIAVVAAAYVTMLIISVECTMQEAKFRSTNDLKSPGQFLPFITGLLGLFGSIMKSFTDWRPKICYQPVRIDTVPDGRDLVFYKQHIKQMPDLPGYRKLEYF